MANLANVALFLSSEGLFCIIDFVNSVDAAQHRVNTHLWLWKLRLGVLGYSMSVEKEECWRRFVKKNTKDNHCIVT